MRTSNIFTNIKKSDHNENQRQSVRHINPMSSKNFFNINNSEGGIARKLAPGITTTVFPGDQAMISVVRLEPEARGVLHRHPEEQWGYCVSGSGIRFQGDDAIAVSAGDFWRTPGDLPHTIE
ncbi:MAG: cupin domain-containing protein, partial [Gammaproteobacteria bacterium]